MQNPFAHLFGNLYATRAGQAELAVTLSKILDDIDHYRQARATIPPGISSPSDIKREAIRALRECGRYSLVPPRELVDLVERLFGAAADKKRTDIRNRTLLREAVSVHVETNLSGRALAKKLRDRGFDAPDRTIANYQKDPEFVERVRQLRQNRSIVPS